MTRLVKEWIETLESDLKSYESDLMKKTGLDLCTLGARASGLEPSFMKESSKVMKVAVVPITTGLGTIDFFSRSVAAILKTMGFFAFVTEGEDVNGIFEAHEKGSHLIFLADDKRFIAMNLHKKQVCENSIATALGYVTALEAVTGSLKNCEVLLLGYGTLGAMILELLKSKGAEVAVYDKNQKKLDSIQDEYVTIFNDKSVIVNYNFIIDATSQGGWIHKDMLHKDIWMVAPGIPLSLDEEALTAYGSRVLHDKLQIGVATMVGMAIKNKDG